MEKNQQILELNAKQNLEELIAAIKPHSTGGANEGKAITIYSLDCFGCPIDPVTGWLYDAKDGYISIGWGEKRSERLILTKFDKYGNGRMIVKVEPYQKEAIYLCPEAWKFYEAAVAQTAEDKAKEAKESTLRKYLTHG